MNRVIKVATRGSKLALAQTGMIIDRLKSLYPQLDFIVESIKTKGDTITDKPLYTFRGTGVFVKEIREALLAGRADLAVHSLKDVPVIEDEKLILASFPEREDPRDCLLTKEGTTLRDLQPGAIIGTSSQRRMMQLRLSRRDLIFKDIRGNLDTRITKMHNSEYDAIVVAVAGMKRLGLSCPDSSILSIKESIPAAGQGILAIECRRDDEETIKLVERLNNIRSETAARAERACLQTLGGGCTLPLAAYAECCDNVLRLMAFAGDPDSMRYVYLNSDSDQGRESPDVAGRKLAMKMLELCEEKKINLNREI